MTGPARRPGPEGPAIRGAVAAVLKRPDLWPTAAAVAWRMVPRRWWRRPPHLPVPPADYLRFRLETMYGKDGGRVQPADLVAYLEWCRRGRSAAM